MTFAGDPAVLLNVPGPGLAAPSIVAAGTPEQKRRFLDDVFGVASDEPRFGEVAREMAAGDWLTPRLNGELYSNKPVFFFWSITAASRITGELDERAVRLRNIAEQRKSERERVLGGGDGIALRGVHDDDAALSCGIETWQVGGPVPTCLSEPPTGIREDDVRRSIGLTAVIFALAVWAFPSTATALQCPVDFGGGVTRIYEVDPASACAYGQGNLGEDGQDQFLGIGSHGQQIDFIDPAIDPVWPVSWSRSAELSAPPVAGSWLTRFWCND